MDFPDENRHRRGESKTVRPLADAIKNFRPNTDRMGRCTDEDRQSSGSSTKAGGIALESMAMAML